MCQPTPHPSPLPSFNYEGQKDVSSKEEARYIIESLKTKL